MIRWSNFRLSLPVSWPRTARSFRPWHDRPPSAVRSVTQLEPQEPRTSTRHVRPIRSRPMIMPTTTDAHIKAAVFSPRSAPTQTCRTSSSGRETRRTPCGPAAAILRVCEWQSLPTKYCSTPSTSRSPNTHRQKSRHTTILEYHGSDPTPRARFSQTHSVESWALVSYSQPPQQGDSRDE